MTALVHGTLHGKKHAWLWLALVAAAVGLAVRRPAPPDLPPLVVELGRRATVPGADDAFVEDEQVAGVVPLGAGTLVITPHRAGRTRLGWRDPVRWRAIIVSSPAAWPVAPAPAPPAELPARQVERSHTLGGIMGAGAQRVALVDGRPVGVGDRVGDAVVESIEDERVVLRHGTMRSELSLEPR